MSGDARRALEICRRAAEFADYRIKQSQQSGKTCANKGTVKICVGISFPAKVFSLDFYSLCLHKPWPPIQNYSLRS
jgi:hypothetical protein